MIKRTWYFGMATALLLSGSPSVSAQERGASPPGPGNPFAALQAQIDALAEQVASLSAGLSGAVQGGAESGLFVIRGTVSPSGTVLQGAGYSVTTTNNLPCGSPNTYPEYHVTFDQPFSAPPTVVVSARAVATPPNSGNAPVFVAGIDNGAGGGGVTTTGFGLVVHTDAFGSSTPCFGTYHWDFIAIGPR